MINYMKLGFYLFFFRNKRERERRKEKKKGVRGILWSCHCQCALLGGI